MEDFFIKQIDRLPTISTRLTSSTGYVDLGTGSSVSFIYKPYYNVSGAAVTGSASIVSAVSGNVQYQWGTGDVYTPGVFLAEWRVNFADGRQLTDPYDGYIVFEIQPRII